MELQNDARATAAYRQYRDHLLRHRDDLQAAREWSPERAAFEHFNWAFDWFDTVAHRSDEPALIVVDEDSCRTVGYLRLAEDSLRAASWLEALGIRAGDPIMLVLDNRPELWELTLACIRLGAVVVPCTTTIAPTELRERIDRLQPAALACDVADRIGAIPGDLLRIAVGSPLPPGWTDYGESYAVPPAFHRTRRTRGDEPLLIYFTSGTTSRPKRVTHTHSSYPVGHLSGMYWSGLRPGDRHLNLAAPGWAKHAWSNLFAPFAAEATVVALAPPAPHPRLALRTLGDHRIDSFCAPPTVWRQLVQHDLASHRVALREATSAGEPLNPEVASIVRRAWGVDIREGYGQTETTAQIGIPPGCAAPAGSMGRPLPGYTIRLLDPETGRAAAAGEIAIATQPRPIGLAAGIAHKSGWYRTGDLASVDSAGHLYFLGRRDDVFKSAGHRISPFEVESALLTHPSVVEAAVAAFADPLRATVAKAFVRLTANATPDRAVAMDIIRHAAAALPPHAVPRRIEFCARLPVTASGKIRRAELRRRPPGVDEFIVADRDQPSSLVL
jgi:acetyl-CoA synthetase